jgi:hypothetical protein
MCQWWSARSNNLTNNSNGWCPNEGKGRGGAKRVDTDAPYAELRAHLGIQVS